MSGLGWAGEDVGGYGNEYHQPTIEKRNPRGYGIVICFFLDIMQCWFVAHRITSLSLESVLIILSNALEVCTTFAIW